MSARLLRALDARIAKTRNPLENTCLRAEKAAFLARQGQLDQARAELAVIHLRYDGRPNAVVSAWTSLAEGLVSHFANLGWTARDKMKRSLALSQAVQALPLQALSAAWLAQLDYASLDFDPMLIHLTLALRTAAPSHHSARSRACLVAAVAYHWAERFDLAQPWYGRARQHALAEGDDSTISALMHNMSWLRVAEARRLSISGEVDLTRARHARLGAESTYWYDEMIGMAALGSLVPMLRAQVLVLHSCFAEALELFGANLANSLSEGLGRMECVFLADVAWCRINTGDTVGARRDAKAAIAAVATDTHDDDLAVTHSRVAQVFAASSEPDLAGQHAAAASVAWSGHARRQSQLVSELSTTLQGL